MARGFLTNLNYSLQMYAIPMESRRPRPSGGRGRPQALGRADGQLNTNSWQHRR
jgi:hypothetical protein